MFKLKKFEFDEKDMDEAIKEMMKEQEEKHKKNLYFIKHNQNETMNRMMKIIEKEGSFHDEDLLYREKEYDVNLEEYYFLFDNLSAYAEEFDLIGFEDDNIFEHKLYYLNYEDKKILIQIMWGQGTAISFKLADDDGWDEELSFSYEDFKNEIYNILSGEDSEKKLKHEAMKKTKKVLREMRISLKSLEELIDSKEVKVFPIETKSKLKENKNELKKMIERLKREINKNK